MSASSKMDIKLCEEISECIDKLTTSGQKQLNTDIMKRLKKVCKRSDNYVVYAHGLLVTQLRKEHAEIRLSAFQTCDELFNRSHVFRELILADFQEFMNLTTEADPQWALPLPKEAAKTLKRSALDAIHLWNEKYGNDYKKLSLGYNYLKNCRKMDFTGTEVRSQAEQRRIDEQQQRQDVMRRQRLENVLKEIAENSLNIKDVLVQVENCLKLLLPDPESFQIHGLMSPQHKPSFTNPFLSYAKRTPTELSAAKTSTTKKTSDTSKIKGRRNSQKEPITTDDAIIVKREPEEINPAESPKYKHGGNQEKPKVKKERCSSKEVHETSTASLTTPAEAQTVDTPQCADTASTTCTISKTTNSDDVTKLQQTELNHLTSPKTKAVCDDTGDVAPERGSDASDNDALSENEDFEEISTPSSSDDEDEVGEEDVVRDHGLMSQLYRLQVELNPEDLGIRETEDNSDILLALQDLARQVTTKFMPQVHRWLEVLAKTGAEQRDIQKAIDIMNALKLAKKRTGSFRIIPKAKILTSQRSKESVGEDDDDDSDFEDVPTKEGYEDDVPEHLREPVVPKEPKLPTATEWQFPQVRPKKRKVSEEIDPTTPQATLKKLMADKLREQKAATTAIKMEPGIVKQEEAGTSSGRSSGTLKDVPVIPYGMDLFHWGEKKEVPLVVRYEPNHRFWNPSFDGDDIVDKAALASMNTRIINFAGNFEPVKWSCRAPLQNGTLCPRRDRYKCPFHGKVIARDNMGRPSNSEDAIRLAEEEIKKRKEELADWEDPDLQAEIEAATGVSLNPSGARSKGGKKGRKRKESGLTNINKMKSTAKSRLEKKVLSPRALRRVEDQMSSMSNKRFKDKFGNNYNYAIN